MKFKKIYASLAVLTLILAAGVASVSAYQGDYSKSGPNCTPVRHAAMEAAFDNNGYKAWAEQMTGKGRLTQIINESNFARFAEAHRLGQAGDTAGADAIRAELGLRTSNGEKAGSGYGGGNGGQKGQGLGQGNGNGRNFVDNNGDGACDGDGINLN